MFFQLLSLFYGCSKEESTKEEENAYVTEGTRSDCDPLDTSLCAFPFPSSFFETSQPDYPTGIALDFGPLSLPVNIDGKTTDPTLWNEKDGFSPLTPIMTYFEDVSLEGVMGHDRLEDYSNDDVKTVVIDVETGERVPHWAELDMSHDQDDRRAFRIYPATPMEWGHHYVVGIRGLQDEDGNTIAAGESFRALRDGYPTQNYDIDHRVDLYENIIFPTLENTGFLREELQIAWDFHIGSKEHSLRQVLHMKQDALDRVTGGVSYEITEIVEYDVSENTHTARRIFGTMMVPNYTENTGPGVLLTRDENGLPFYNGDREIEFTIVVPRSLWEEGRSGPIVQYGHGLMGSQGEVKGGYLSEMADRYGYVLLAVNWTGMSEDDLNSIVLTVINEIGRFGIIPERSQQGFIEQMTAVETLAGNLGQDAALTTVDTDGNPISVIDSSQLYYYGNSQGGILGNAYFALSPHFERGVLGVSGAPYALLLPRSVDFDGYFLIFKTMYPDFMDISLWMGLMQTLWDPGEPTAYLDSIHDPLEGNPHKEVLLQIAIGDAQVTPLGAHIQARGMGAKLLQPAIRPIWGLEDMQSGEVGSAIVEWDYGLEVPFESIPPDGYDPHSRPRNNFAGQQQLNHFLMTGEVVNYCGDEGCFEELD